MKNGNKYVVREEKKKCQESDVIMRRYQCDWSKKVS